ncbi:uncharacterized protein C19orf47 homolog isoform X2 [Hyperolius riggenbachi]|uniref:uncharacterized protein C19orf47 homolog isoform X2 n=1 Tax=Hyperolius riggenbachi TaxID=752182 RepID=UPI0035A2B628
MASVTMATSEWISFFKEAGIPAGPAVNYAVTFVDNRIHKNMLLDLNKDIMNELGITVVGDVIAILKHAKVVHKQDMCKAMTEPPSQASLQSELRRNANSPATRMIANSLSRDSPPSTPVRRPETSTSKISVTVSNKVAMKNAQVAAVSAPTPESEEVPLKCRRVTAEMEGKYIINMPKGTTPRTKRILEEQAAKSLPRTSVFDRLGAESKADSTTGAKPTGVFSRLGDARDGDRSVESDEDSSVLQYAGVLKKKKATPIVREKLTPGVTVKAKATSTEQKPVVTTFKRLATKPPASAPAKLSIPKVTLAQRLGTVQQVTVEERKRKVPSAALAQRLGKLKVEAQDSKVSSTKPPPPTFKVTIKRTLGTSRVTSSSDCGSAQMDNTGSVSVFKRLGRKSV